MRERNSLIEFKTLFRIYDLNGSGFIAEQEFMHVLGKISSQTWSEFPKDKEMLEKICRTTVQELDRQNKGGMGFREFKSIFEQRIDYSHPRHR